MFTLNIPATVHQLPWIIGMLIVDSLAVLAAPNLLLPVPSPFCSGVSPELSGYAPSTQLLQAAFEIERDPLFIAMTHGACFELRGFYTFTENGHSSIVLVFDHYVGTYLRCGIWPARMIWEEIQVSPNFVGDTYAHAFTVHSYEFMGFTGNIDFGCPPTIYSSVEIKIDRSSPAVYLPGETITILYNITNILNPSMDIAQTPCIFHFQIRANNTEGPLIYDSVKHDNCVKDPDVRTLGPGQSYARSLTWNQTADSGDRVPDGVYEVMGAYGNQIGPAGLAYIGIGVEPVRDWFYFEISSDFSTYPAAKPVRIGLNLANIGPDIVNVTLTPCSFSYTIVDIENKTVYSLDSHRDCTGPAQLTMVAPQGGLGEEYYWDQINDTGLRVAPGDYRLIGHAYILGTSHRFDFSKSWSIRISVPK